MRNITTKDRFTGAIKGAPTMGSAVNLVTAIHHANMNELLDDIQQRVELQGSGVAFTLQDVQQLRNEYGTSEANL